MDRKKSQIKDLYPEDEMESVDCEVDTQTLKKVIVEYLQARAEFLKSKNGDAV